MNRQQIRTFLEVLDTRNFNRAAERLNIMQSTVSARIRQLEQNLGVRLFERGRGGAEPTAAARRFEAHAHAFMSLFGHMQNDMRYSGTAVARMLRLSCQHSLMRPYLLDWADALTAENPRLALGLETNFSEQIQRDILNGNTDIGIMFAPQLIPDLQVAPLHPIDFVMVSTSSETLAGVEPQGYAKIRYTSYFERVHDEALPELAFPPRILGSEDLGLEFLSRHGGSAYLPRFALGTARDRISGLRMIDDAPVLSHPVYSAIQTRKSADPLLVWALKALDTTMARRSIDIFDQSLNTSN